MISARAPIVDVGRDPEVPILFRRVQEAFEEGGALAVARAAALTHQLVVTVHGLATGLTGGMPPPARRPASGSANSRASVLPVPPVPPAPPAPPAPAAPPGDPAIAAALAIIRREATLGLIPQVLAQRVHRGYSTLRRSFKRQTGYSLKEYILRVQLRHAKTLLALTSQPIGEVARESGFEDRLYFSRVFKTREAQSPKAFRRANQRA